MPNKKFGQQIKKDFTPQEAEEIFIETMAELLVELIKKEINEKSLSSEN